MAQLYTDLYGSRVRTSRAANAFRALLRLYTQRIAETTNSIEATKYRLLYRLIAKFLAGGVRPRDLVIVTFNHDLQAEKCLNLMSGMARWSEFESSLFNFPHCYKLGDFPVTGPTGDATPVFKERDQQDESVAVLKLHGSLNWYSTHNSANPPPTAMFNPNRALNITRRIKIDPRMRLNRTTRTAYTLPVIVPPVVHKAAVLHTALRPIWDRAERAIEAANEIVIFGYSCPPLDFEAANLLRRAHKNSSAHLTIIDPAFAAVARYIDLLRPWQLTCFLSAKAFLDSRAE